MSHNRQDTNIQFGIPFYKHLNIHDHRDHNTTNNIKSTTVVTHIKCQDMTLITIQTLN